MGRGLLQNSERGREESQWGDRVWEDLHQVLASSSRAVFGRARFLSILVARVCSRHTEMEGRGSRVVFGVGARGRIE